jgi:hypothetical protein
MFSGSPEARKKKTQKKAKATPTLFSARTHTDDPPKIQRLITSANKGKGRRPLVVDPQYEAALINEFKTVYTQVRQRYRASVDGALEEIAPCVKWGPGS